MTGSRTPSPDPTRIPRRSLLTAGLAAGTAVAAGVGARPARAQDARAEAARKEGKVVWYTSLALTSAEKVAKMFEAAHAPIKVEVHRTGSQRVLQRLMQEVQANIKNADVIHTSDAGHFVLLKEKKLLMKYQPAGVDAFPAGFKDRDGYHYGLRATVNCIVYNPKVVAAADAPKTWKDLRLHEAFGITTLYVTHDQAEAMVISDRVAVLHRGRLAQVGRVADLFERPRTRFVAEFVGKTNLVEAIGEAPGVVARDGVRLRVGGDPVPRGAAVALSIRPHALALVGDGEPAPAADNVLAGVVERATYLGDAVDYHVRLDASDLVLRVSAPPARRRQPGDRVRLAVPAEACVLLAADAP